MLIVGAAGAAEDRQDGHLRDLRVGLRVGDLPAEAYVDLACGSDGGAASSAATSSPARPPSRSRRSKVEPRRVLAATRRRLSRSARIGRDRAVASCRAAIKLFIE